MGCRESLNRLSLHHLLFFTVLYCRMVESMNPGIFLVVLILKKGDVIA
nr:MAG TPA: hypothetical protein [Caudoviricetes sp.]